MINSLTTNESKQLTRGYTIALICAAVLSLTAIFIRYLTETYHLPPLVLAFWRDSFVALTLLVVLASPRIHLLSVSRRHLRYLLVYGVVLAVFNSFWTLSVALNGAAVSTVLVYCSAAFTALLGRWLLKEHLDWVKLAVIGLTLAGCVLVSGAMEASAWQSNLPGILTGVFSGLSYAAYSLMGRSASQRGLNPWTTLFYTFAFAAVILLAANLLAGPWLPGAASRPADFFWLGRAWAGWVILFLLAAGPTLLGFGLYNVSLVYLPSSIANLVATSEPVFTAIVAYFLLGERLTATQLLGSLLIIGGVCLLWLYEGWRTKRQRSRNDEQSISVS